MKVIIQRVTQASVKVENQVVGEIGKGMLVFLGIGKNDSHKDADYLIDKISQLRIFDDQQGKMNCSAVDCGASFLIVSQFTLYADCSKGRRPSFDGAASPEAAEELYIYFINTMKSRGLTVETGKFRASMNVSLDNDGPVTLMIES